MPHSLCSPTLAALAVWFGIMCGVLVNHTHHKHILTLVIIWEFSANGIFPFLLRFLWLCTSMVLSEWEQDEHSCFSFFSGLKALQGSLLFYSDVQLITTSASVCANHWQTRWDSLTRIYSLFLTALSTFPSLLNSWGLHYLCRYIYESVYFLKA